MTLCRNLPPTCTRDSRQRSDCAWTIVDCRWDASVLLGIEGLGIPATVFGGMALTFNLLIQLSFAVYTYGLHSYGLYMLAYIVMAYTVIAYILNYGLHGLAYILMAYM